MFSFQTLIVFVRRPALKYPPFFLDFQSPCRESFSPATARDSLSADQFSNKHYKLLLNYFFVISVPIINGRKTFEQID